MAETYTLDLRITRHGGRCGGFRMKTLPKKTVTAEQAADYLRIFNEMATRMLAEPTGEPGSPTEGK